MSITVAGMSVELLNAMGDDLTVVNSARVSFDKHSDALTERDKGLIGYLARNKHWTPFAHCFVSFRVKMPIFVARQMIRHTVGLVVNEVSRRYVDYAPEFYMPDAWRARADNVKQGSSTTETVDMAHDLVESHTQECLNVYEDLLALNVAPELARLVLPLNTMTQWVWSGSLAAFARVCALRLKPDAQKESRIIAEAVDRILSERFPESWKALIKYQE